MRAVNFRSFGGPEVLELIEADKPKPLPTEVLVRVKAAALNPVDRFVRAGAFPIVAPPDVLGWDLSGVVEELVPGVTRFAVGDEVFGMPFFPRPARAHAEFAVAPSRQLAKKPRNLSHEQAAALPLVGLTAYQSLVEIAALEPGQRVLIHGGGGGVGHMAVQIAKLLGAHVAATASAEKHAFVRALGADQVIDYRAADFAAQLRDFDVVLELVGRGYAQRSIAVLRPGGLLITAVERTNLELAAQVRDAGRRFAGVTVEPDYRGLEQLARWAEQEKLRVHVSQTFPLARSADAHRALEQGVLGKIVLTM